MKSKFSKTNARTSKQFRAIGLYWPPHRAKRKRRTGTSEAKEIISNKLRSNQKPNQKVTRPTRTKTRTKTRTRARTTIRSQITSRKKHFLSQLALVIGLINYLANCQTTTTTTTTPDQTSPSTTALLLGRPENYQGFTPRTNNTQPNPSNTQSPSPNSYLLSNNNSERGFEVKLEPNSNVKESGVPVPDANRTPRLIDGGSSNETSQQVKPGPISPALDHEPSNEYTYTYSDNVPDSNSDPSQEKPDWQLNANVNARIGPPPTRPMSNRYQASRQHYHPVSPLRNNNNNWHPNNQLRPFYGRARWGPNKIYKRVLLCDKTLISLDYLRREPMAVSRWPDGISMAHDSGWDETLADVDSGFDDFFGQQTNSSTTSSYDAPSHNHNHNQNRAIRTRSVPIFGGEPEWLLPDEDPLVLCDMWDLEKGLLNRKPPEQLLSMAIKADFNTVREAIKRCRQLSERALPIDNTQYRDAVEISTEDMVSMFSIKRGLIPGTKWCGLGDIAATYNDLGQKRRIDICCRAHDHCPIRLKPFRNDYGLFNIALYTKSHCECDADFYRCLREVRSKTADMLGNLYFNVMKLQCLREEPMKMCREIRPLALGLERCMKYEQSVNKTVFRFSAPPRSY